MSHPASLVDAAVALSPEVAKETFDPFEFEKNNNDSWKASYDLLNSRLATILANPALPSRALLIGLDFFRYLLRYDSPCPPELVDVILSRAIGDTPQQVTLCLDALLSICRQIRRRPVKTIKRFSETSKNVSSFKSGERPDNQAFLYDPAQAEITTAEQWASQIFIDKTYIGFSCWAPDLGVYSGATVLQPLRDETEMLPTERLFFSYFCGGDKTNGTHSTAYLQTFIDRLVHQVHAGDGMTFLWKVVYIFKTLLRLFYPVLLEPVLDEIDRLLTDEQPSSAPASQATAAELFAAVIRASKFWPFEVIKKASTRLLASLEVALRNMTADWEDCWISCFSTLAGDLDPRRIHWLIVWLLNDWQNGSSSSSSSERSAAAEATRLSLLQSLVEQTEWRAPALKAMVFKQLVTGTASPYKTVRHRAGQFVASILTTDPTWFSTGNVTSLLPTWDLLCKEMGAQMSDWVAVIGSPSSSQMQVDGVVPSAESVKQTILNSPEFCRCKLLMEVITASVGTVVTKVPLCLLDLLPTFVSLDAIAIGIDDELRTLAITSSAILGMGRLNEESLKVKALDVVEGLIRNHPSWQTRRQALCVLQVAVFHNLYELSITPTLAARICALLVACLDDTTVEVREMASVTLSGLLQCGFLKASPELIASFNNAARTSVGRTGMANRDAAIRRRHAGVLGLAAIITAFPYSVPKFLPSVLTSLTDHVGDPPPIAATARRALTDFRRTHHDQWFVHREHFTEDQLAALSSVLVSPNYYA